MKTRIEVTSQNEDGVDEIWAVYFRRLTARQTVEFEQILLDEDVSAVERTISAAKVSILRIEANGESYTDVNDFEDLPFEVIDRALAERMTFQQPAD